MCSFAHAQKAQDFSLDVCATTQLYTADTTRTIVTIKWSSTPTTPISTNYRFKAKNSLFWSAPVAMSVNDTCFTDTIATGTEREYQVIVDTSGVLFDYLKFGNILVGRKVPATIQYGRLLILIDSIYINAIDPELDRYKLDLIADGYIPVVKYVNSTSTVISVKALISAEYAITTTPFFGAILLGNVPVPYSGDYDGTAFGPPDGHTTTMAPPSHEGAWATDLYYGDMSAATFWTDATVTNTLGARTANHNIPGDGKFDQTAMPTAIEVPIGRVDLTDLPAFSVSDTVLLQRYLTKNHNYREGLTNYRSRVLQDDELGLITGEPFGANSYQIANPIWGDSVDQLDWSNLTSNNYQWAQGYGFGAYDRCINVDTTINFATNTYNATFTSLFGSYFGDFDISNNLLRAALASEGEILTSVWSGRPKWYFHQMGTGNPIGLSTLMSQNAYNGTYLVYPDALYGAGLVHPSFHGDITLKLNPYETVPELRIVQDSCNNRFVISWDRHTDSTVFEYVLQRTESLDSSFLDLAISTTDTFYIDSFPSTGLNYYMVRGIKPIENCSGMHYELSHGLIDSVEYREPIAYAGNDTSVCNGLDVPLGTSITYDTFIQFSWSPSALLSDSSLQQPIWTVTQNQEFELSAIDSITGCIDLDTIAITMIPLPLDTINPPTLYNSCGDTISINASHAAAGKTYDWTFTTGNPATAGGAGNHIVDWTVAGNYALYLSIYNTTTQCVKQDTYMHTVACILPVNLLSAEAEFDQNCENVIAKWTSTAEYNLQGYYLEFYAGHQLLKRTFVAAKSNNLNQLSVYNIAVNNIPKANRFALFELDNNATKHVLIEKSIEGGSCKSEIEVFPNPLFLNNQRTLALRNLRGIQNVTIYNTSGKEVIRENITGKTEVNLALENSLSPGVYFIDLDGTRLKLVVY